MYDPPAYVWAITIAGPTAVAALTCIALYGGAKRAGLGRRRAALLGGAAAALLGGWLITTAVITPCRGFRSRWPASWARCWRSAGSRWWHAPWRLPA